MKEKLVGKIKKRPGLHIYEYNPLTKEIKRLPETKKITVTEKCLYRQSLNAESCIKKLKRQGIVSEKDSIIFLTK